MAVKKKTELEQLINDVHSHQINYHTREIYLHSSYADDTEAGVEFRMATTFIKNLHILCAQNAELPIIVHMHSIGGSWTDGMAIFNAIRFAPNPVVIIAYAQAESMSGIILQAADYRVMTTDCEFMLHYGSIALGGSALGAKSYMDLNERNSKRMLDIFANRAKNGTFFKERGYNEARIRAYLDRKMKDKADWYLDSDKAVYYGLADGILGSENHDTIDILRICEKYKGKL